MKRDNKLIGFVPLFITYLIVKVVHKLAGFDYDLFTEGILSIRFTVDVASWGLVYAIVYFLLKEVLRQKNASA